MKTHLEQRHVVILNVTRRHGHESIGPFRVLPESIVDVAPLDVKGARVAVALPGREPLNLEVTESPELVIRAITYARDLDGVHLHARTNSA